MHLDRPKFTSLIAHVSGSYKINLELFYFPYPSHALITVLLRVVCNLDGSFFFPQWTQTLVHSKVALNFFNFLSSYVVVHWLTKNQLRPVRFAY